MSGRTERFGILLDWFTVRYSTVAIALGVLVAVAAGGTWAIVHFRNKDRQDAHDEIQQAQRLRENAAPMAHDTRLKELLKATDGKLADAVGSYDAHAWADARTAALVAQTSAQRLIDLGRGAAESSSVVRFYRIEGEVRVKRAGQFHWDSANSKMVLNTGDQIKTSGTSVVELIYSDGAVTTLRPGSLLEIKEVFQEPVTRARRVRERLSWGEVQATTRKSDAEGSFHEVSTDTVTARTTDESSFTVKSDEGSGSGAVSVFAGGVEVGAGSRTLALGPLQRVAVSGGALSEVENLPMVPRLVQPPDQKVFTWTRPEDSKATLVWEKVPEAARYRLQVSERWLFTEPVVDSDTLAKTSVELTGLRPSSYYWRVFAIDGDGRSGPSSTVRRFKVSTGNLSTGSDSVPPPLQVDDSVLTGQILIVSGRTEPGATVWIEGERVDVNDLGEFTSVVRLRKDGENLVRLTAQDPAGNETTRQERVFVESY